MKQEFLKNMVQPLLAWFKEHARTLPWRENPAPYYVWVSEIMLQQTRVEAVKPYFAQFTESLPDVRALADCPEDRLLKLWEGLGYYSRVRNMQKAAKIIVRDYGGELPRTREELLALPGIGSYTAGAIASIAWGQAVPAVDGNVLRVISRITENPGDIMKQSVRREAERELTAVMPQDCPGTFNQALMELGALVCLPNGAPDCANCPVSELCLAYQDGRQKEFPVKKAKAERRVEDRTVLVIRDSTRAVLRRRPDHGLLAGLYELPNYSGHLTQEEALALVKAGGLSPIRIWPLPPARHIFSHIEWRMTGCLILVEDVEEKDAGLPDAKREAASKPEHAGRLRDSAGAGKSPEAEPAEESAAEAPFLLVEPQRTEREFPLPAAFAAYTSYLNIRIGQEKYGSP